MISVIQQISDSFAVVMIIALCGAGVFFTLRLNFIQVRKFFACFRASFGSFSLSGKNADGEGMSSYQSLATAIAAQVGTGNIAGAATAIVSGGPGAIFWMWVSAFLGMATTFAEATLAQKYKTKQGEQVVGGPAYYLRYAFPGAVGRILAGVFALVAIITMGFTGNMVQINSLSSAFSTAFGFNKLLVGVVLAVASFFVFQGGMQRIASVVEKIVPLMAVIYLLAAFMVIAAHIDNLGLAFRSIFVGAFHPQAVLGGATGITLKETIRYGVSRGLFSNEAGMGSTPHAHAVAKVKHPCDQGLVAIMGVFIDTFIILSVTALTILTTGVLGGQTTGIDLAGAAFATVFGQHGGTIIAVCLFFFAYSSIIGWYFFAELNVRYLFGEKKIKLFAVLVCLGIVTGSVLHVDIVWSLADLLNSMMVIPNVIGLFALSGVVVRYQKQFERRR